MANLTGDGKIDCADCGWVHDVWQPCEPPPGSECYDRIINAKGNQR